RVLFRAGAAISALVLLVLSVANVLAGIIPFGEIKTNQLLLFGDHNNSDQIISADFGTISLGSGGSSGGQVSSLLGSDPHIGISLKASGTPFPGSGGYGWAELVYSF